METMSDQQTILIAGANGSIGYAAALALAKRGARVVLLGRHADKLSARAAQIHSAMSETSAHDKKSDVSNVETLIIDFSDMQSVRRAAKDATSRFPIINGLILSVGALVQDGPNVLPSGHELMFATNVIGPFLFTEQLLPSMEKGDALILDVIAMFKKDLDWNDLQSIKNHKPMTAFNRTKQCNRVIAAESARRYAGKVSCVAFDPTYVIDKTDPDLADRWPSGFIGFFWRVLTILMAKKPVVAGEAIADLFFNYQDRQSINGALFKLKNRIEKPDKAMTDEGLGHRLWDELVRLTADNDTREVVGKFGETTDRHSVGKVKVHEPPKINA